MLHVDDPDADWPWPVIVSGPGDTTPRAPEVGRDAVVATVATVAALEREPSSGTQTPGRGNQAMRP